MGIAKEVFNCVRFDDVLDNWEAAPYCAPQVVKRSMSWIPPLEGNFKFNVDGAARG